jgi:putative addiction module component (TIGR02574 family)
MHPAMTQLSNLPVSERLTLVQELWDSIAQSQAEMPIQDWHREIINARLADFDGRETEPGLTRENVWEQVDQKRDT